MKSEIEPIGNWGSEALSPAVRQRLFADMAREQIKAITQANARAMGRVPSYKVAVDGRNNAPLESVKPHGGKIVVEWSMLDDVLRWIADELVARSPIASGRYRDSHALVVDGVQVSLEGPIPNGKEYVFTNPVPYARKIEVGKTKSGRAFLLHTRNRIYERTAQDAKRQFGNNADIAFAYREATGAYQLRRSVGRRRDRQAGANVLAPSIIVRTRAV